MRRAAAIDKNQNEIVDALRKNGAHVTITSQLKNAFDLVVVHSGKIYLVEVKDGTLTASARKLTEGEMKCKQSIENAGGVYHVINSTREAMQMIGIKKKDSELKATCVKCGSHSYVGESCDCWFR